MHHLPETGYLRLPQIIGQDEVTEEQAKQNRQTGKGPKRPRPVITPIIPVGKSTWWDGVKSGRFPPPVKLTPGVSAWHVSLIRQISRRWR